MIAHGSHVDKVDDNQAADVTQSQLTRDLDRRLEVGVQRRLFDIGTLRGARRIHVDGDQRLGTIKHQRTSGFELHVLRECRIDLMFNLKAGEQRCLVLV